MRVQAELEWQNRCEDMKAEHYLANEQLLHDLTKTREQVSVPYTAQRCLHYILSTLLYI